MADNADNKVGKPNKAGLIATGIVIGAVAGVVAALLLAPKSGKETRGAIKERLAAIPEGLRRRRARNGAEEETGGDAHRQETPAS